jgi:choline dehydrogenase
MIVYVGAIPHERRLLVRPSVNLQWSAGEISVVSTDPHIQPALNYRYLADPFDMQRMRECVRLCRRLVEGGAFEGLIDERHLPAPGDLVSDAALDAWTLQAVNTGHHSSGTCKMGPDRDPLAVVDQTGKVYGVEGVRVVDASIMPDCVRANTNATVMMMAEYIADLIVSPDLNVPGTWESPRHV